MSKLTNSYLLSQGHVIFDSLPHPNSKLRPTLGAYRIQLSVSMFLYPDRPSSCDVIHPNKTLQYKVLKICHSLNNTRVLHSSVCLEIPCNFFSPLLFVTTEVMLNRLRAARWRNHISISSDVKKFFFFFYKYSHWV